jgi:hypothetical protein
VIVLIVTTQNNQSDKFERFLESLNRQNEQVKRLFKLIIVNQDQVKIDDTPLKFAHQTINCNPCSLSAARNKGLALIDDEECIVGFPDDDCWYNTTVLERVETILHEGYDFIAMGVYDDIRKVSYGGRPLGVRIDINVANAVLLPVSVSIFVQKGKGKKIEFDENFSVGTEWGCGEESDLILELLSHNRKGVYDSIDSVYHEVEDIKFFDAKRAHKYGVGFGALIAKSIYTRQQTGLRRILKKIRFRTCVAKFLFAFNGIKRKMYTARLKGLKDGFRQARQVYGKGW